MTCIEQIPIKRSTKMMEKTFFANFCCPLSGSPSGNWIPIHVNARRAVSSGFIVAFSTDIFFINIYFKMFWITCSFVTEPIQWTRSTVGPASDFIQFVYRIIWIFHTINYYSSSSPSLSYKTTTFMQRDSIWFQEKNWIGTYGIDLIHPMGCMIPYSIFIEFVDWIKFRNGKKLNSNGIC